MAVFDFHHARAFNKDRADNARDTILLVGIDPVYVQDLVAIGLPAGSDMFFADVGALNPTVLAEVAPSLIVAPLVAPEVDAIDLANTLTELRFGGELRLITHPLADRQMVETELRDAAPELAITVLELPKLPL